MNEISLHQNSSLIDPLVTIGFTQKEAQVYLSLLSLELASVAEIAEATDFSRSTVQYVLDELMQKGLVSASDDTSVRHYVACAPDVLLTIAKSLWHKYERVTKELTQIVPELKALNAGAKKKPTVQMFYGKAGLVELYEDLFNTDEKVLRVASSLEHSAKVINADYLEDYHQRRFAQHIVMKGIHPRTEFTKGLRDKLENSIDDQVFIPSEHFRSPVDIAIYADRFAYTSLSSGGVGIFVQSADMADIMKKVFDLAFDGARTIPGHEYIPPRGKIGSV